MLLENRQQTYRNQIKVITEKWLKSLKTHFKNVIWIELKSSIEIIYYLIYRQA